MSDKVMWLEGMVLSPHHFQQAENLLSQDLSARLKLLGPFHYGLASMDLDLEALQSGFFALRECSGVFPDGTWFAYPSQDRRLDQRPFESSFSAAQDNLGVFLAAPALQPGNPNFAAEAADEAKPPRYLGQTRETPDLNSGGNARAVTFGRLNLRILFEGESTAGLQTLKIAELRRDSQGRVQPDDGFFPTCLRLSGAAGLVSRLKKLADNAQQKSVYLMAQRAQKSTGADRKSTRL